LFELGVLFGFIVIVFCVLVVFGRLSLMMNSTNFSSKLLIVNLSKPSILLQHSTLMYVQECFQMGFCQMLHFLGMLHRKLV